MKISVEHHEISKVISEQYSVKLHFNTIDSKTLEVSYKPNRFMSMRINIHIDEVRKDVIRLSYDCSSAMSLIISGVAAHMEESLPKAMDVDTSSKRINLYPERFDELKKVLELAELSDISLTENSVELSMTI